MPIFLSPPDLNIIHREADRAARRLVRCHRLNHADRADLCHDLLVDLFGRLRSFDPSRGTLAAFAATVIWHGALRVTAGLRRDRAFVAVSLDDPSREHDGDLWGCRFANEDGYLALMGNATNPIMELERRLSLDRAFNTLPPEHLALCKDLVDGSFWRSDAETGPSRATRYRQLAEVRLCFLTGGLGPRT